MAKTLEKMRKQIAKKKGGTLDVLHQNSRNARRLHKAQVRDERLEKIAETRKKQDRPLRASFMYPDDNRRHKS
jgi:translation machinery-associated protein 16